MSLTGSQLFSGLNVRPHLSFHDAVDGAPCNAKISCENSARFATSEPFPDRDYTVVGERSLRVRLASLGAPSPGEPMPPLSNHVVVVILGAANEKVIGVDARRVVTPMQRKFAGKKRSPDLHTKNVTGDMHGTPVYLDLAIPGGAPPASPLPALVGASFVCEPVDSPFNGHAVRSQNNGRASMLTPSLVVLLAPPARDNAPAASRLAACVHTDKYNSSWRRVQCL